MNRNAVKDVRSIQKHASQVQRLADAVVNDKTFVASLVDAAHGGSSAALERLIKDVGVESDVYISITDGVEPGTGAAAKAKKSGARTKTTTVTIGIGWFSISVTVKKETKDTKE